MDMKENDIPVSEGAGIHRCLEWSKKKGRMLELKKKTHSPQPSMETNSRDPPKYLVKPLVNFTICPVQQHDTHVA